MAYILAVNPLILSEAGVPIEGALFATAVAAAADLLDRQRAGAGLHLLLAHQAAVGEGK